MLRIRFHGRGGQGMKTASRLAQAMYALVRSWEPIQENTAGTTAPAAPLVEVLFDPPWRATPSIAAEVGP